jgi:hypothetical protein
VVGDDHYYGGDVVEVPEDVARDWVALGYAVEADEPARKGRAKKR